MAQDVVVTIDVANPAPRIGLGVPIVFVPGAGATAYKEYRTMTALEADYTNATEVHNVVDYILMQKDRPEKVAVATFDADLSTAIPKVFAQPFHFALVASEDIDDKTALANYFNDANFKIAAIQSDNLTDLATFEGKKRVISFFHNVEGERLDAAAVGALGSLPVGSVTWKFKSLKGITPVALTEDEMNSVDDNKAIAYVVKGGRGQLSEGWLADGSYIDSVHGQDWIKADMENEISYALAQTPKVSFDGNGIGIVNAAMTTTMKRASLNGIVALTDDGLYDYSITTLPRSQMDAQDVKDRIYRGASFDYKDSGAIHAVRVKGQVLV